MSMPVFLDSCPYDHMPNGSLNQWKDFFSPHTFELEANAFFPLFWLLLFQQDNIKLAYYMDDQDIAEESQTYRDEYLKEMGETHYPYFIVSQAHALENLSARKVGFLKIFGNDFAEYYSRFQHIIQENYPQYILLRTNGLDLDKNSEEEFKSELKHYENLEFEASEDDLTYWKNIQKNMSRYQDLNYFLQGANHSKTDHGYSDHFESSNDLKPDYIYKDLPSYVYWIFGIIIAVPTILAWRDTHSNLYAFLTFAIFATIFCTIAIKLTRKINQP